MEVIWQASETHSYLSKEFRGNALHLKEIQNEIILNKNE